MTLQRPADEVARLGNEIYERDIRSQVEPDHHGEYVVIDVDSGCWSLGTNLLQAREQLDLQRDDPDSRNVFGLRVGFDVLRHFGGRPLLGSRRSRVLSTNGLRPWSRCNSAAPTAMFSWSTQSSTPDTTAI